MVDAPFNDELEQHLLGTLMVRNSAIDDVADILDAHHFYVPVHGRIYAAIRVLRDAGQHVDSITVAQACGAATDNDLADVGGTEYVADLVGSVITVAMPMQHAQAIVDLWRRREVVAMVDRKRAALADIDPDDRRSVADQIADFGNELDQIAEDNPDDPGLEPVSIAGQSFLQRVSDAMEGKRPPLLSTGLPALDEAIGGGLREVLTVLGGRPGMGKTSLAETIAWHVAGNGGRVAFFSQEMSRETLVGKQISAMTGIPFSRMEKGQIDKRREFLRVVNAKEHIVSLPVFVDQMASLTPSQMLRRARRIQRRGGLSLVIVDHLGIMSDDGAQARSNYERMSSVIKGLQRVQKQLGVPVLVLAQLNREVEKRNEKRPNLADFRDTGQVEEYARVILLAYRDEYYVQRDRPSTDDENYDAKLIAWEGRRAASKGLAEVQVAKNELGAAGFTVDLGFDALRTRFHTLGEPIRDFDAVQQDSMDL